MVRLTKRSSRQIASNVWRIIFFSVCKASCLIGYRDSNEWIAADVYAISNFYERCLEKLDREEL